MQKTWLVMPPLLILAAMVFTVPPRDTRPVAPPLHLFHHVSTLGVEEVAHLTPHIGYLKLSAFPPHFFMADKYAAAIHALADTDSLIVDLRENEDGRPETVALLLSYFVDGRTRSGERAAAPGGRRYGAGKPIVILSGPGTTCAGEDFAHAMQAQKRATVVGERTVCPIDRRNREDAGVRPDIRTAPDRALAVARELLERRGRQMMVDLATPFR